jgi:hypothetical protein
MRLFEIVILEEPFRLSHLKGDEGSQGWEAFSDSLIKRDFPIFNLSPAF